MFETLHGPEIDGHAGTVRSADDEDISPRKSPFRR